MQLRPLFARRPKADGPDASDDFWYGPVSRPTAAGIGVTVQKALTLPVVYDCLQVLSQTIGALPFAIFERRPDGSKLRRSFPQLTWRWTLPQGIRQLRAAMLGAGLTAGEWRSDRYRRLLRLSTLMERGELDPSLRRQEPAYRELQRFR